MGEASSVSYNVDAFLQLMEHGSSQYLEGESTDAGLTKPSAFQASRRALAAKMGATYKAGPGEGKKPIEILSFSLIPPGGVGGDDEEEEEEGTITGSGGRRTDGRKKKAQRKSDSIEFEVSKHVDIASPILLMKYCETTARKPWEMKNDPGASQFDVAKVTIRKSGGDQIRFLVFRFGGVNIVSYDLKVDSQYPLETIRFSFREFEMRYHPQEMIGDRSVKQVATWNFEGKGNFRALDVLARIRDPEDV